jgi:hypothetical protein
MLTFILAGVVFLCFVSISHLSLLFYLISRISYLEKQSFFIIDPSSIEVEEDQDEADWWKRGEEFHNEFKQ